VRHGESENNITMARVFKEQVSMGADRQATEVAWLSQRTDDPALSPKGLQQAEDFAAYYAEGLEHRGCVVYCSPMLRTLQTTKPLAERTQCKVVVRSDLFEVGGVYTLAYGGVRGGPGKCLSAEEITSRFPGYDVSGLSPHGPWYTQGWETDAEGRSRCRALTSWLRSDELREKLHGRILVIVCHGHFIDMLIKALIGHPDEEAYDRPTHNNHSERPVHLVAQNTSTAYLAIGPSARVTMHSFGDISHLRCFSRGRL